MSSPVLIMAFLLGSLSLFAQNLTKLQVNVDVSATKEGDLIFMLFNDKDGFPKERSQAAYTGSVVIAGKRLPLTLFKIFQMVIMPFLFI